MADLYTRAVKTGPDGDWVDVPVTETYASRPAEIEERGDGFTLVSLGKVDTRPVSWAMIRPGDRVLHGGKRYTVDIMENAAVKNSPRTVHLWDEHSRDYVTVAPDAIALIVDGDPPEHRAGHPAWWPR